MVKQRVQRHSSENSGDSYKGIPIYTEPGTHEAIFDIFSSKVRPGRVLELGAGAGAFAKRLADHGFEVVASDISAKTFQADVEFRQVDLALPFASIFMDTSFTAIVAFEVIEHLENPLHFLREVAKLLNHENSLWVSFPNIYFFSAVQDFVRRGEFAHWSSKQYWDTGHQTILTDWLFKAHCEKCGLAVRRQFYCNPVDLRRAYPGIVKRVLGWSLMTAVSAMSRLPLEARRAESVLLEVIRSEA